MSKSEDTVDRLGEIFESVTDEAEVTTEGEIDNDREVSEDDEFDGVEDGLDDAIEGAGADGAGGDAGAK